MEYLAVYAEQNLDQSANTREVGRGAKDMQLDVVTAELDGVDALYSMVSAANEEAAGLAARDERDAVYIKLA